MNIKRMVLQNMSFQCAHDKLIIVILVLLPWLHVCIIYLFIVPTLLIDMPLTSFDDVIASIPIRRAHSMSSLKNGNTVNRNLMETESVFLYMAFCFCFLLTSIMFAAKFYLLFLARPSQLSIYHRFTYLQKCSWPSNCVHIFSRLFYFPIDDFQRKRQLLAPTSCCSSKTSHFRLLRMGLSIMFI